MLWTVGAGHLTFTQKARAAQVAACDILPLSYVNYRSELAAGRTPADLIAIAADHGVTLSFLDGFSDWAPVRYSPTLNDFMKQMLNFSTVEAFQMCHAIGADSIIAIGAFDAGSQPLSALIDAFGGFCDEAKKAGIRVDLEFVPVLGIRTLREAWDVVKGAGASNSTIVFDTWSFMRSEPDYEFLDALPRGTISNVQFVDGHIRVHPESLWADAFHNRLLPGDGEFPLTDITNLLRRNQDIEFVGPEAIFDGQELLGSQALGERVASSMKKALGPYDR